MKTSPMFNYTDSTLGRTLWYWDANFNKYRKVFFSWDEVAKIWPLRIDNNRIVW